MEDKRITAEEILAEIGIHVIVVIRVTSIPAMDQKGLVHTLICPTPPSVHGRGPHCPWQ